MPDANDMDLLRDYDRHGSETAFAELVQRHIALVYSAALRHVGIAAHAEEITQAVFVILARKAAGLRANIVLESWLYETTRLTALSFLRGERRRQFREQEAYMQSLESGDEAVWHQLAPLLDEAVARLGQKDRDAVMLRFFKGQNVREVAAALQINEAAAQRRILRAVDKLRAFFTKRGIALPVAVLTATISAHSVHAAPLTLAKSVTVMAVAKGAAAGGSTLTLIKGALKIMAWTKMKMAIAIGVGVLLAIGTATIIVRETREPQINFQAEGTLDYSINGVPGAHKDFTIFVRGNEWLIHFPVQTNGLDYEEYAFDGKNNYSYVQFDTEKGELNNSQNSSAGVVGTNDIPDLGASSDQSTAVWLAYGATRYFKEITGNKVKSFFYVDRPGPELEQGPYMEVEWQRSKNPPHVPGYIYFPKLNERYQVLQFTNFDGQFLPSEFSEDYFGPNGKTTDTPIISIHGILSKISKPSTVQDFRPKIDGKTYTEDRRFPDGGTGLYVNITKEWFSTNSPQWQGLLKMYNPKAGGLVWPRGHQGVTWP